MEAVSHAFRACYQAKAIYLNGGFTYPLPETAEILKVKTGQYDYKGYVEPKLEEIFKEVMSLAETSTYPEKVDEEFKKSVIFDIVGENYAKQANVIATEYSWK